MADVASWMGLVLAVGAAAVAAAFVLLRRVTSAGEGTPEMKRIADAIREGARAFSRRQYRTIGVLAALVAASLFLLGSARDARAAQRVALAFLFGAACSSVAAWWAMRVSLRANARVAHAARSSTREAFTVALLGGAAAAIPVASGALLGVSALFVLFGGLETPAAAPHQIVGFAFGASFVALFAQLGGGIFTKAADIGADLVGKVEAKIPEDDPRNPAVVADLVGDDVGDCAGRGADIFESAAAENVGAMILGAALTPIFGARGVVFPLVVFAFGLVASIAGVLASRMRHEAEDPMTALGRGHVVTLLLAGVGMYAAVRLVLGASPWMFAAGAVGIAASLVFALVARYYTGARHRPVLGIARACSSGPVTNIVTGLAVGLESTALPVLTISVALFAAHLCGRLALPGVEGAGLYGTAVATTGMLSTVGFVLAVDMFGPITDNAGGIVEMAAEPAEVRARTDRLDAAGNTTKAATKGYAIGSAALAAFLLFSAYLAEATSLARARLTAAGDPLAASFRLGAIDLGNVPLFLAALAGATIVFAFSGMALRAVVRAAEVTVQEARRQLARPEILSGREPPDYARCVDLIMQSALRGMVAPGLVAALGPLALGVLFAAMARLDPTFRAEQAVAAMLMSATMTGIVLASTMNTGGAAWDNAKKLIESGELGGPGSPAHAAAVVGDAVGDPLKDTVGPSIHVLMKLLGTAALVTAPLLA